jgi:hypothetical protein
MAPYRSSVNRVGGIFQNRALSYEKSAFRFFKFPSADIRPFWEGKDKDWGGAGGARTGGARAGI